MSASLASPTAMAIEPPRTGVGTTGRVLLLWYFVAIFTVFSLTVAGQTITCFFALPAAVLMFMRNTSRVSRREVLLLLALLMVALLSSVFGYGEQFMGARLKSWVLFVYSISMTYALRLELGRATRKDISWVAGWLLLGILVAAVLEVLGPLKPFSDAFRQLNAASLYSAEGRDLSLTGFVRPTVFTQEPSYAAIGVAVFSFVWFISTFSRLRLFWFTAATVLTLYLFRSPISVISAGPVALVALPELARSFRGLKRALVLYFTVVVFFAMAIAGGYALIQIFEARNQTVGFVGDQSLLVRLYAPPRIAASVITEAPVLGAGIGGRMAIYSYVELVFSDLGIVSSYLMTSTEDAIPNAFWEHWIYFGAIGGTVAAILIVAYFRPMARGHGFAVTLFALLLANTFGAYSTPRIWSFITLAVLAAGTLSLSRTREASAPTQDPARSRR